MFQEYFAKGSFYKMFWEQFWKWNKHNILFLIINFTFKVVPKNETKLKMELTNKIAINS